MNLEQLQHLLADGEGPTVEFKEARDALPHGLFETVCAFLNRDGGTILLGVTDNGKVAGVDPDAVERLTSDIVNLSNNPQKLDPPCILSPEVVDYNGHGPIRPGHFTPFPKNPTLSKFFMQMGRGEELGSGVLNVNKYLPFYAKGAKPRFIEGDPFVTIIPLPPETGVKSSVKSSVKILQMLTEKQDFTAHELSKVLQLTQRAVEKQISKLQNEGLLRRIGPDKGGHWEVIEVKKG